MNFMKIVFGLLIFVGLTNAEMIRDETKEVVKDTETHLMWQDDSEAVSMAADWSGAIDYCENLTLGGYDDWHLPNINELLSISDMSRYEPALNSIFENVQDNAYYWSSTVTVASVDADITRKYSWIMYTKEGIAKYILQSSTTRVRCVRAPSMPVLKTGETTSYHANDDGALLRGANRDYTDNGDGTITDNATELMWQDDSNVTGRDWKGALEYCADLDLAGKSDWRLPTIDELSSIILMRCTATSCSDPVFKYTGRGMFWSSSAYVANKDMAWIITDSGNAFIEKSSDYLYIRCVRGTFK